MSQRSSIEWTDATWNPIRAQRFDAGPAPIGWHCEKISPGCANCYAETFNGRMLPNGGTGKAYMRKSREWVRTFVDEKTLAQPLKWRKPKRVFVCSMTDLFGEWVTDEQLDRVFAVMAMARQHAFQVLTKRPERMRAYLTTYKRSNALLDAMGEFAPHGVCDWPAWPNACPPHVWLGVSVEDQERADERVPVLLDTPAAVRFVSAEPLLGPVDRLWTRRVFDPSNASTSARPCSDVPQHRETTIDWVIAGGESGPGARPCDVSWIRSIVEQCKAAGVPAFVKQLGSRVECGCGGGLGAWARNHGERRAECARCGLTLPLRDRKGGDPSEWPEDLRVREFPREAVHAP